MSDLLDMSLLRLKRVRVIVEAAMESKRKINDSFLAMHKSAEGDPAVSLNLTLHFFH